MQDRKTFEPAALVKAFDRADSGATLVFDGFKWDTWGKVKRLTDPATVTIPLWVLYVGAGTITKEPTQVAEFVKGLDAGLKGVKGEPQLARTLLGRLEVGTATAGAIVQLVPLVLPDSVRPDVGQIEQTVTVLRDIGYTKGIPWLTDEASLKKIYGP